MNVATAEADDLTGIHALEEHFPADQQWSESAWRDELESSDRLVCVVRADQAVAAVATFQVVGDMADLHRVIVAPDHRGRGLARALLRHGMEWAAARAASSMLLEVAVDNGPARALYRSCGFDDVAARRDYYGPGRDAVVMSVALDHVQGVRT